MQLINRPLTLITKDMFKRYAKIYKYDLNMDR